MYFVWLIVAGCAGLTASLPDFQKCDHAGWSCEVNYKFDHVIFTCSEQTGWDVTVDLESENIHFNTTKLTIQNCKNATLTLSQLTRQPIKSITMLNIQELHLADPSTKPHLFSNPPIIIFRHIGYIPVIPNSTFTFFSDIKAEHITFENVKIGTIEHQAFNVLDASLTINDAVVNLVDTKAIYIHNQDKASVTIRNTTFGNVESKGFQIFSPEVNIFKCRFIKELREQSMVMKGNSFIFYLNDVNIIHQNAFNITAQNITFVSNNFENISNGAFEEVHPSYTDLDPFFYQFRENKINWAEPLALHHNWELNENEIDSATILLYDNHFNCTCALMGLRIILTTDERKKTSKFDFYKALLAEDSNECLDTYCHLPFRDLNFHNESSSYCISSNDLNSLCLLNTRNSSFSKTLSQLLLVTGITIIIMFKRSLC